jgi:glycine/D-amino acid oxidase-like deaminating enzyme
VSSSDVVVIGAGVHGASAAFHLASRGVGCTVLDPRGPAGGPTGRSSAVCRSYYTNAFLAGVARDAIAMMRDFESVTAGRTASFRETGLLVLHPAEDEEAVRATVPRLNEQGIGTDLLEPGDVVERWPAFVVEDIAVAAFERGAGYADPVLVTRGLLERARELGADLRLDVAATTVERDGDAWRVGTTGDDDVTAGRVLIAAGPWTKPLAAQVGADLPLSVERHIVASFAWGGDVRVPAHGDLPNGYYFRPEGEDLFIMGPLHPEPTADPDAFDERLGDAEAARMAEAVVRRVPSLEEASARGGRVSLYDVSPDWQPVIGEIAPGVFVDAGTSGHGFKLAPALGVHIADLLTGVDAYPGLEQFHPRRFEQADALDAGFGEARILG